MKKKQKEQKMNKKTKPTIEDLIIHGEVKFVWEDAPTDKPIIFYEYKGEDYLFYKDRGTDVILDRESERGEAIYDEAFLK